MHIGQGAPVLVEAVRLKRDFLPKGKVRGGLLGFLAVGLGLLRTVDPVQAQTPRLDMLSYGRQKSSRSGHRGHRV